MTLFSTANRSPSAWWDSRITLYIPILESHQFPGPNQQPLTYIHDAPVRTKSRKQIPKIASLPNGWIAEQRVRCGKPNCRCSRDRANLHIGFYFFARIDGRLIKWYVRKAEVPELKKAIEQARTSRQTDREITRFSIDHWRKLRDTVRSISSDGSST